LHGKKASMDIDSSNGQNPSRIELVRQSDESLVISLSGNWVTGNEIPNAALVKTELDADPGIRHVEFEVGKLLRWDSVLLTFLIRVHHFCEAGHIDWCPDGLPEGVVKLLNLVFAVPEAKGVSKDVIHHSWFYRIGHSLIEKRKSAERQLEFLGELCFSLMRFFRGKAQYRRIDMWLMIEDCGPSALPIVTLISVLVGLILAFVGAVQLSMFGAQIYIANLVGLGMAREMGALMTAVIMAGRTGAAFAAQLGTMKVNEEIDALKTMGLSPMDFLVLPRVIALVLMMPLLCLYADCMGILGGMVVGVGMMDLSLVEYYTQTKAALALRDFNVGLFKSMVFGVLVAIAGCMRGMESGRSSSAVGDAATNAVVTGIVWIIISDSILTIIYNAIGV